MAIEAPAGVTPAMFALPELSLGKYDGTIPDTGSPGPDAPAAAEIVGLIAEDHRLRLVAALALGAGTLAEAVEATGLDTREAVVALDRLTRGGLVVAADGERIRLATERLKEAAREVGRTRTAEDLGEGATGSAPADAVLRSFLRGGKLVSIPTGRAKRLVVLEWLAGRFEPGRTYPEPETNRILDEVHPDHAALRRYLVDEGFLERRDGFYWRAGGAFEVD
jgi:hypothetical protein